MRVIKLWFSVGGALILTSKLAYAEPTVRIVQPYENANLPFVKQSFVFGSVSPATATLTVNGVAVKPHTNGGFLTMIPFQEGKFIIEAVAKDGLNVTTTTRTVNVQQAVVGFPVNQSAIEPLSPRQRVVLRPGDELDVSFQGAPGGIAHFRIGGGNLIPMEEFTGRIPGIYKGTYRIKTSDDWDDEDVIFILKRQDGRRISKKAGAKLIVQRRLTPRHIELKEESVLLTGPDTDYGYNLFLVPGTRLEVTGEWGDYLRVSLGNSNQGWIKKASASELPDGSVIPRSVSKNLRVNFSTGGTLLEIPLQYRHPYRIEELPDVHSLRLTLYGVSADSDRIRYRDGKSVIQEVLWHQSEPGLCFFDIRLKEPLPWGYDVRFDGTTLVLEIRHRPVVTTKGSLKGLKIAVDAGHSPQSFGTIGPLGNTEASIVLTVAKAVKQEFERRGAEVVMIQDGARELSLQDRVNLAWKERAHAYFSLHADACAEGQNPFELEGYSVHYFHSHSRRLAEAVHRLYGQRTVFRDQGIWRSNLAVCRMTQMPSILLEQGFLIVPSSEEIMLSAKHHKQVADLLVAAMIEILN